ncbi:threonyl-tRNA synthetase [Hamadaea flava]|uniref:Threonine--tRNA ligase n=1 Tax=Hamadaea flava TaxID=1742688 RepID=A0ABV8LYM7_9ACTN|nr:threonine--tRNA ligase [Hamadaea flava]MCP2324573.1 threonyl-tRNA synthetase [Hamadaea flava]
MNDHRKLGRELELFHSDPLVGAGLPIWLPAGAAARHAVEEYIREEERLAGYQHVYSPPMAKHEMYVRSGHVAKFADDMFPPMADDSAPEGEALVLRPSMCPHHAMVFAARGRSYRELPVRVAELGGQYRAERSGVLSGLSRVRAISLNDAHVFCRVDQVGAEVANMLALIKRAHAALGFSVDSYRLSLRGEKFLGESEVWDAAEGMLRDALIAEGVSFFEAPGEAAFYGPKIDLQIHDVQGRELSLATIQVDFAQPERFDLAYVDSEGVKQRPVMVHRSIIGSLERLFAHLIEVHQGAFPAWYAPVQLAVVPIGEAQRDAAWALHDRASRSGLRVEVLEEGSLSLRVREAAQRKIPYAAVIGAREAAAGAVALRLRDGRSLDPQPVGEALDLIQSVVAAHSVALLP